MIKIEINADQINGKTETFYASKIAFSNGVAAWILPDGVLSMCKAEYITSISTSVEP